MVPLPQRASALYQLSVSSPQPVVKSPPPRSIMHTPADPAVVDPGGDSDKPSVQHHAV